LRIFLKGGNQMSKKLIASFIFAIVAVFFSVLAVTASENALVSDLEARIAAAIAEPPPGVEAYRAYRLSKYEPEVAAVMADVHRECDNLFTRQWFTFLGDREAEDLTEACWAGFSVSFSTQVVTESGLHIEYSSRTFFGGMLDCGNPSFRTNATKTRPMTRERAIELGVIDASCVPVVSEPTVAVEVPEISALCCDDCVAEILEPAGIALSSFGEHRGIETFAYAAASVVENGNRILLYQLRQIHWAVYCTRWPLFIMNGAGIDQSWINSDAGVHLTYLGTDTRPMANDFSAAVTGYTFSRHGSTPQRRTITSHIYPWDVFVPWSVYIGICIC
jgi:hypothetical protein